MKKILYFFLSLAIIGTVFTYCSRPQQQAQNDETKIPVEVETVTLGNVVQSLYYNGDIEAEYEVKVFSKVPDRIEKFYVDEGDRIQKGEPIAKIYAATIEQAVRQAEAGLLAARAQEANTKLEYERAKRLFGENAMSKQQYDAIETQYQAVKAQLQQAEVGLETAKSRLEDATVRAPISGIIGRRNFEAGDMASPTMPLITLVQMDKVKITFDATEEDLGKLAIGQQATIRVRSYQDRTFTGKVVKISPVLDPLTRMAKVEVLIDNKGHVLKPGMYANVEVTTGIIESAIVVPRFATIENTTLETIDGEDTVIKNYYVYVTKEGKAEQRKLTVSYVNHERIAVKSGLKVGEKLITAGINNLRDGVPVSIIEESNTQ